MDTQEASPQELTHAEYIAAQKRRNAWLACALVAFIVLVGVTSVVRISTTDYSKSDGFYFTGAIPEIEREPSTRQTPPPDGDGA